MTKRFRTVLVANRGEIAVRVIRGARELGYETIAVYSEADRGSLHVREAHRAVCIGPAAAAESYLSIERILSAARESGAEAVHPGYGFLSERADFARAVQEAGLVFIGPDPASMAAMGNKSAAKTRMLEAGVPCVPGYQGADDPERFIEAARQIGYPVMIKAAAGGGGRGMRLVHSEEALAESLRAARSEAEGAFGSGELLLEKAIVGGRHVEIQVFGDRHGNVVHFGERDCSVQRRNQKVVEEAPGPAVNEALRAAMGAAAVKAAMAVSYVGAGTVEFLLDHDGRFYFLEMNTRLQVEHAVTELVYDVDLVAWQLSVAQGERLPLGQEDILRRRRGHAIEVRLCTEDPGKGYLPQTGTVRRWEAPSGAGVRVDTYLETGSIIGPHYDSMQAKVIAHGADRESARARLQSALASTVLFGVGSNRDFLARIIGSDAFASGDVATDFLVHNDLARDPETSTHHTAIAAACLWVDDGNALGRAHDLDDLVGWQSALTMPAPLALCRGEETAALSVSATRRDALRIAVQGAAPVELRELSASEGTLRYTAGAVRSVARYARDGDTLWLDADGTLAVYIDRTYLPAETAIEGADGIVRANMDGKVLRVSVAPGDTVDKGSALVVIEAMKLELEFASKIAGVVREVGVRPGDQVTSGHVLVRVEIATP